MAAGLHTDICKKIIAPRIPEGEAIVDEDDLSMEQINEEFKKRMKEYKNFVRFIIEDLKLKDNSKVLEIGPGPAWISIILVREKPTISLTGLEISEDMIRLAKQNIIMALGIKAIFILLGAMGLATMWAAVFGDVGVTILTVLNSLRLLR